MTSRAPTAPSSRPSSRSVGLPPEVDKEFLVITPNEVVEHLVGRAENELERLTAGVSKDLLDGIYVRVGTPWDAICTEARTLDVDLILLGSHGYSGLDRILGTTAAKVVNHADRSVMVVRPKPGES